MDFNKIRKKIVIFEGIKNKAKEKKNSIINSAKEDYWNKTKEGKYFVKELIEKAEPLIIDLINVGGCNCHREYPSDIRIYKGVFQARVDASHPNDIRDYEFSFEDVFK